MPILRHILLAAIPAGLIAGGALSLVQIPFVLPLIHEAETHEHGSRAPAPESETLESPVESSDLAPRFAFTMLSNLLIGIAAGLLLASAMTLHGGVLGARCGLLWGLAGFTAFALAPALGLPPELPGVGAAPLGARQLWWVFTVAATAGGLALLFLQESLYAMVLGAALLALPHIFGAPQPESLGGTAPEVLAREFVRASLLAAFLFWIVMGTAVGFRLARLTKA